MRRPALPRPRAALAATAVLAVTAAGGAAAWSASATTVQLSVDGEPRSVRLHGETVADVLAEAGLSAGEHDVLAPTAGSPVADGDAVALRRGRELRLVVDGAPRTTWVTAASVDEALDTLGLRDERAALSASRSRAIGPEGLTLRVRTPKDVRIRVDRRWVPVTTAAPDLRRAVADAGVRLRPTDRLTPAGGTALRDGAVVRVTRIDRKRVVESERIPYGTVRRDDPSRTVGEERVVREGGPGVLQRTVDVGLVDGVPKSRSLVSEVRRVAPRAEVVAVGTKPRPAPRPEPEQVDSPQAQSQQSGSPAPPRSAPVPSGGVTSGGGLNWAALAACESGGDPGAVSSTGTYHGLYQFDQSTWQSVGGSGLPSSASAGEQTARAQALYARAGRAPWPTCGGRL